VPTTAPAVFTAYSVPAARPPSRSSTSRTSSGSVAPIAAVGRSRTTPSTMNWNVPNATTPGSKARKNPRYAGSTAVRIAGKPSAKTPIIASRAA
jgi:hypothetical protein